VEGNKTCYRDARTEHCWYPVFSETRLIIVAPFLATQPAAGHYSNLRLQCGMVPFRSVQTYRFISHNGSWRWHDKQLQQIRLHSAARYSSCAHGLVKTAFTYRLLQAFIRETSTDLKRQKLHYEKLQRLIYLNNMNYESWGVHRCPKFRLGRSVLCCCV
jgi:hypothetical protein